MILDQLVQHGNNAINNKDWNGACQLWMKVWEQDPTHPWAKGKLGKVLLELERFEEAEQLFMEDVEAYPNRPYALIHLAKIAQLQERWELAQERWERLFNHFPDYEWALQPYADTLKQLGNLNKAERFYHMDIALHPYHFRSSLALIEIALTKEQFQLTRHRIEWFVKKYPKKVSCIEKYNASLQTVYKNIKLKDYISFGTWENANWRFQVAKEHQFMYSPIPKVASSTLAMSLYTVTQGKRPPKGLPGKEISNTFANQNSSDELLISQLKAILVLRDYFAFTFIRNPYTRILSAFLDKVQKTHRIDYRSPLGFKPVGVEEVTFLDFLKRVQRIEPHQLNPHFSPQWYLLGSEKLIKFDFIGRFESLEEDLQFVLDRIDKNRRIKRIISRRPHATNAAEKINLNYGPEEQALVAEIYKDDFKYFGYGLALPNF